MNNHQHQGGGFTSGLLWGLLIGGGVVFLLGTKKGKKLLKVITEGLEDVSEITDLLEEDEFEDYEEPVKVSKNPVSKEEKENHINGELKHEEQSISHVVNHHAHAAAQGFGGRAKRLFKGIPRKS